MCVCLGLEKGIFFSRSNFYSKSSFSRSNFYRQFIKAMDGHTGSLDLPAVLAQIGQGLVVQQETTTRILETMNRTTRSTITGIPIPEFGGKATESPKLWLLDIRRYLQATFPDGSPDLGVTLRTGPREIREIPNLPVHRRRRRCYILCYSDCQKSLVIAVSRVSARARRRRRRCAGRLGIARGPEPTIAFYDLGYPVGISG